MNIRKANSCDLPQLQTLFRDVIQAVCAKDYSPDQINVWIKGANNTEKWLAKLNSQYFIVAEINEQIVGFASLENNNYFDFLYVHKDFLRQGVAANLLNEIECEAKKAGTKVMLADVSITARPFFEKNKYKVIKQNENSIEGVSIINYKMQKNIV